MNAPCPEWRLLINADLDGELDAGRAADLAAHISTCAACSALQRDLLALRAHLAADLPTHPAPAALRQMLAPQPMPARALPWRLPTAFASGAIAASLALMLWIQPVPAALSDQLLESHLRALQPGHLIDVASSDQHNVKPWFDGKLDFAPPVKDLSAAGFALAGGRLDYIGGRPVAVLIYRRQLHVIDLYIRPGPDSTAASAFRGYNLIAWPQDGFTCMAISDLNAAELQQFGDLFRDSP